MHYLWQQHHWLFTSKASRPNRFKWESLNESHLLTPHKLWEEVQERRKKHTTSQVAFVKKVSNGSFSWVGWTQFLWWWENTSHCKIFWRHCIEEKIRDELALDWHRRGRALKIILKAWSAALSFLSSQDHYHQLPGGKELENCFLIKYCF